MAKLNIAENARPRQACANCVQLQQERRELLERIQILRQALERETDAMVEYIADDIERRVREEMKEGANENGNTKQEAASEREI